MSRSRLRTSVRGKHTLDRRHSSRAELTFKARSLHKQSISIAQQSRTRDRFRFEEVGGTVRFSGDFGECQVLRQAVEGATATDEHHAPCALRCPRTQAHAHARVRPTSRSTSREVIHHKSAAKCCSPKVCKRWHHAQGMP